MKLKSQSMQNFAHRVELRISILRKGFIKVPHESG